MRFTSLKISAWIAASIGVFQDRKRGAGFSVTLQALVSINISNTAQYRRNRKIEQ